MSQFAICRFAIVDSPYDVGAHARHNARARSRQNNDDDDGNDDDSYDADFIAYLT